MKLQEYRNADFVQDYCELYSLTNGPNVGLLYGPHLTVGRPGSITNIPTRIVCARSVVYCGALNEQPGEQGFSHLAEHLKAWTGVPEQAPAERGFWAQLRYGGDTGLYSNAYMARFHPEDFGEYIEKLYIQLFSHEFNDAKVEHQKTDLANEMRERKSQSFYDSLKYFTYLLGENFPTLKLYNINDVIHATAQKLSSFCQREYIPNNTLLIFGGELPDDAPSTIEKVFGGVNPGSEPIIQLDTPSQLEQRIKLSTPTPELINRRDRNNSTAHFYIGMIGVPETNQDNYALRMASEILCGSLNSRLINAIRRKLQLSYNIKARYQGEVGIFTIQGAVHQKNLDKVISACFAELANLQSNEVGMEELNAAKIRVLGDIGQEGEERVRGILKIIHKNWDIGVRRGNTDLRTTTREYVNGILDVTPKKIQEIANKYFPQSRTEGPRHVIWVRDPFLKHEVVERY